MTGETPRAATVEFDHVTKHYDAARLRTGMGERSTT